MMVADIMCVSLHILVLACAVSTSLSLHTTTRSATDNPAQTPLSTKPKPSDTNTTPSETDLNTLATFLDGLDLVKLSKTQEFKDLLHIVKDEGKDVVLPSNTSLNDTREITLAFFRMNLLSVVRRALARKPASHWFPQPRDVNNVCYSHLMAYIEALVGRASNNSEAEQHAGEVDRRDDWAMTMFDSTGKPSSGIMVGKLQFIGDYDTCIDTKVSLLSGTHSASHHFNGRYCRARLPMGQHIDRRLPDNVNTFWLEEEHLPININWGLCVPDSCGDDDIRAFLTDGTMGVFNLPVEEVTCFEESNLSGDAGAIVVIVLLTLFAFAVTLCTIIDLYRTGRENSTSGSMFWWWEDKQCSKPKRTEDLTNSKTSRRSAASHTNADDKAGQASDKAVECRGDNGGASGKFASGADNSDVVTKGAEISPVAQAGDTNANGCPAADNIQECELPFPLTTCKTSEDEKDSTKVDTESRGPQGITNDGFEMCDLGEGTASTNENIAEPQIDVSAGISDKKIVEKGKVQTPNIDVECANLNSEKKEMECLQNGTFSVEVEGRKARCHEQSESTCDHIIKGTSLYNNFRQLLNTDVSSSKPTIKCLEGLKAITMCWIVLGHTYTFGGIIDDGNVVYDNSLEMTNIPHRLAFHIVGSAQFGVDTFFVISGCLVMYISLSKLRSARDKASFWSMFVFHRFWRLTPVYMMVLAVGTTLYDHIVSGPLKAQNLEEFDQCRDKWWAHLLYINNFYAPEKKCMTWTWYLAVDMQFHVLSPLLIYPAFRNRRVGGVLIACLLAVGITSAFVSELVYGGQFLLMDMNFVDYWSYVYQMPWVRVGAFAIGLLLGVVLRDLDNGNNAWDRWMPRTGVRSLVTPMLWLLSIGVGIGLALVTHVQWKHGSGHWDRPALALFESLSRPAWSLAVAWVVFACNTGRAGPVAKILSWPPFVTLSRLSYSVYLLHPLIIMFVVYSRRTAIYLHPNRIDQVYNYLGNLILTHLFAVVFYLLVESPLRSLEVLWEPRARKKNI